MAEETKANNTTKEVMVVAKNTTKKPDQGARNLTILGISAILLAIAATGLELWIYHESGDIYLDRSRPGFLPDADEAEEETSVASNYSYSENGALDGKELDTYLQELKKIEDLLVKIQNPYGANALSDESLGINAE